MHVSTFHPPTRVATRLQYCLCPRALKLNRVAVVPSVASNGQSTDASAPSNRLPILKIRPEVFEKGGLNPAEEPPQARANFEALLAQNFLPVNLSFPGLRIINVDPPMLRVEDFLSAEECASLVAAAERSPDLRPSDVGGYPTDAGNRQNIRTSRTLALTQPVLQRDSIVKESLDKVLAKASKLLKIAPEAMPSSSQMFLKPTKPGQIAFELPQVARYMEGQHFLEHEDAFPLAVARSKCYQRRATLLIYLNTVPRGGATHFNLVDLSVQPKQGTALLFFPSFVNGAPDPRTLHIAQSAVDEKWVSQMWIAVGLPPAPLPRVANAALLQHGGKSGNKRKRAK